MKKLHFEITIHATPKAVWECMLTDETYRKWTAEFNPNGSWFEGSWEKGSTIKFIGPDDKGELGGMVSRIADLRLHEFVSIEHLAVLHGSVSDMTSKEVQSWAGAREEYTFIPREDGTRLLIDVDTVDEFQDMFEGIWPKALDVLKQICEKA